MSLKLAKDRKFTLVYEDGVGQNRTVQLWEATSAAGYSLANQGLYNFKYRDADYTNWTVWERLDSSGRKMVQKGRDWVGSLVSVTSR